MKQNIENEYMTFMMLVCLLKVYHDEGIKVFGNTDANEVINNFDFFYMYIMEAVQNAAPITVYSENLYAKHGFNEEDGEVYIWAYSSKEMQEYFKIARKLNRLEGRGGKENPYEQEIMDKIEDLRGFRSYDFDYTIGHKRKGAWLEVLWGYEFTCEIPMCLWIVRTMRLLRDELPKLKEKYRAARRFKRSNSKRGGLYYANEE